MSPVAMPGKFWVYASVNATPQTLRCPMPIPAAPLPKVVLMVRTRSAACAAADRLLVTPESSGSSAAMV